MSALVGNTYTLGMLSETGHNMISELLFRGTKEWDIS